MIGSQQQKGVQCRQSERSDLAEAACRSYRSTGICWCSPAQLLRASLLVLMKKEVLYTGMERVSAGSVYTSTRLVLAQLAQLDSQLANLEPLWNFSLLFEVIVPRAACSRTKW
jgi:hypothetical protein